jgi:hypothetical protein
MIVNGAINITVPTSTNVQIRGTIVASGNVTLNASTPSTTSTINTLYDSCLVSEALQGLGGGESSSSTTSPQILSYRELSF